MRLAAPFLLLAVPILAQPAADYAAKTDAVIQSYVRDGLFRGSAVVAKDGQPVFRKSYGMANSEWEIPNAPDTKFRIGSITKQFTAIAILQLAEQGKLKLDAPVAAYYTEAPAAWEKVTVHHLLNHTSGIPAYTELKGFFEKKSRDPLSPGEVVRLTQYEPLQFEPGSQYRYNNTAYVLLGELIEKASGMKYGDYIVKNVMGPAGMTDSGYDWSAPVIRKRASGYTPAGANAPFLDMSLPHAAGSLYSTVDDMVKWDLALHAGKLIGKESWAKMTTPGKSDYGYGLGIDKKTAGHLKQAHGGGINGFNTFFARFPEDKVAVAVFANMNTSAPDKLADAMARLYFGEDVKPRDAVTEIKLTGEQLDAFKGSYELRPGFALAVRREGEQLIVQATNQPALPVIPIGEDKFLLKGVDARLEFVRSAEGKIESVILHQNGRAMPGKRIE